VVDDFKSFGCELGDFCGAGVYIEHPVALFALEVMVVMPRQKLKKGPQGPFSISGDGWLMRTHRFDFERIGDPRESVQAQTPDGRC
jgi:hypothetical protein